MNVKQLKRPDIAYPTIAIFFLGSISWIVVFLLALEGQLPMIVAVILLTVLSYGLFTPMHESVHGSVARFKLLNDFIGRSACFFMGPTSSYTAYRYLHMEHHKHTNDSTDDPDIWSGMGPIVTLPLVWLTTDIYYVLFYSRRMKDRPFKELMTIYIEYAVSIGILITAIMTGYAMEVMVYWVLPTRLAAGLLSLTFNYLPHYPYDETNKTNEYRATRIIEGPEPWTSLSFTLHNYHLIHHLYPQYPFYWYKKCFRALKGELENKGARIAYYWHKEAEQPTPLQSVSTTNPANEALIKVLGELRDFYRGRGRVLEEKERNLLELYYETEILDVVRVVELSSLKEIELPSSLQPIFNDINQLPIPLYDIKGLTLIDTIVISSDKVETTKQLHTVLFQELVHICQFKRLGKSAFISEYMASWTEGGSKNENISIERIAEVLKDRFVCHPETPFKVASYISVPKITATPPVQDSKLTIDSSYADRVISFVGYAQMKNRIMKIYGISEMQERIEPMIVNDALRVCVELLGQYTSNAGMEPGFLIIHEAADGYYLLVDWWTGGNMLHHEVFYKSAITDLNWRSLDDPNIAACVWELEIIYAERNAWIKHVLKCALQPDIHGYLNSIAG